MENKGHNGNAERLDRIEGIIEALATSQADLVQSQGQLLTAQVILTETVDKLGKRLNQLAASTETGINALIAAQQHTDEHMDAPIATVDDIIRGKK